MDTLQDLPEAPDVQFRVLIIGKANAGKTSILQRVCDTTESPEIYSVDSSGTRNRVRSRFHCTSNLISWPGSTESYNGGWEGLPFSAGDADLMIRLVQRGEHDIKHEIMFSKHMGYVFHDSRGFEGGSEDELRTVQDFVRHRSRATRLKDRLHAIWSVPFSVLNRKFTAVCFSGTAFRWTLLDHR
jgi:GTPase SAR1 family protein